MTRSCAPSRFSSSSCSSNRVGELSRVVPRITGHTSQASAHTSEPAGRRSECIDPFFGHRRLNKISPALVQDWVTQAKADGLAARSIRKYHVFLSSDFVRAVKDRVLVYNPCDHTELPKVVAAKSHT